MRLARLPRVSAGRAVIGTAMAKVLLIGNFRPSLPLARQLAKAGHQVFCGVDRPSPYLFASRHVHGCFLHARLDERPHVALEHIRRYLQARPGLDALIPVSESAMRLISANREAIPAGVRLILPSRTVVDACTNKDFMFGLCDRSGIAVAPRSVVEDRLSLVRAVAAIGRPCIIKPVDSPALLFGVKAIVVGSDTDLDCALPHWPEEHDRLCVQRFVVGPRHNVVFAAEGGSLVRAVEFRAVRTDRIDATGYSTAVESAVPTPSIQRATEALLESLDYTGIGMLQFMIDAASGEGSFLELNPRLGGSSGAAEACGLPICRLMLELGLGAPVVRPVDPWRYPVGRRVVWTRGDIAGFAAEARRGALSFPEALGWGAAVVRDAFRRHHLTLDSTDLLPSMLSFVHPVMAKAGVARHLGLGAKVQSALQQAGSSPVHRERGRAFTAPSKIRARGLPVPIEAG